VPSKSLLGYAFDLTMPFFLSVCLSLFASVCLPFVMSVFKYFRIYYIIAVGLSLTVSSLVVSVLRYFVVSVFVIYWICYLLMSPRSHFGSRCMAQGPVDLAGSFVRLCGSCQAWGQWLTTSCTFCRTISSLCRLCTVSLLYFKDAVNSSNQQSGNK